MIEQPKLDVASFAELTCQVLILSTNKENDLHVFSSLRALTKAAYHYDVRVYANLPSGMF
jgi:hypothetical protein